MRAFLLASATAATFVGDHQDPRLFGWLRGFIRKAFLEGTGLEGLVRAVMAEGRRR